MKALWTMFLKSLQLPKKEAAFALNRIRMDVVVFYLFILIAVSSIPSYVKQLLEADDVSIFIFTIFFFIFHYLIVLIIIFALLSLIAAILFFVTKLAKRKLHYAILWKMSAGSSTIPFLLYTIFAFFYEVESIFLTLSILFILIIGVKIIFIYPKRRDEKISK